MKPLILVLALMLTGLSSIADQPPLPAPPVAPTATDSAMTSVTTNAISATTSGMEEGLRDPFWPIGYEPAPPEPDLTPEEIAKGKLEQEIKKKLHWPTLQLKGITHAGKERYMAIIEGVGPVEPDQTISLQRGKIIYSWLIEDVTEKGVMFRRLEARPAPSRHRWFRR